MKENIVRVVGLWVVGMIFQIAHSLHSLQIDRYENRYVLDVVDSTDKQLLELQTRLRQIAVKKLSGRPNRVFIDYCQWHLDRSLEVVRNAVERGELSVQDHHFETIDSVLEAFDGCTDRTFRCVWRVEKGEKLFDNTWRDYMRKLVELSRRKLPHSRVQIRVLFVLADRVQLDRVPVRKVLGFVAGENGFYYRLMLQDDYEERLRDGGLDEQYEDFGIYGDHLLFRTKSYEPNMGVFSDNQTLIRGYRKMHDAAMDGATTVSEPTGLPRNVSLEEFLNCDDVAGAEELRGRGV